MGAATTFSSGSQIAAISTSGIDAQRPTWTLPCPWTPTTATRTFSLGPTVLRGASASAGSPPERAAPAKRDCSRNSRRLKRLMEGPLSCRGDCWKPRSRSIGRGSDVLRHDVRLAILARQEFRRLRVAGDGLRLRIELDLAAHREIGLVQVHPVVLQVVAESVERLVGRLVLPERIV